MALTQTQPAARLAKPSLESLIEELCVDGPFRFEFEDAHNRRVTASLRRCSELNARLSGNLRCERGNPVQMSLNLGHCFESNWEHDGYFDVTIKTALFRWLSNGPEPSDEAYADDLERIEVLSQNPLILWISDEDADFIRARWGV